MYKKILLFAVPFIAALGLVYFLEITEAQALPPSISGRFYKFDVVAAAGQFNLNSQPPTINSAGTVAFINSIIVRTEGSHGFDQILARNITGQMVNVTSTNIPSSGYRYFSNGMQLNDVDKVVASSQRSTSPTAEGDSISEVRIWDATQLESSVLVASIVNVNNTGTTYDWQGEAYAASLNNLNQPVFVGGGRVNSGIRPNFNSLIGNFGDVARPVVDDNGNIVTKETNSTGSRIRFHTYNFATSTEIATVSATSFSELGEAPGVSDSGEVIAFYGNLATGALSGPGIFLSIPQSGGGRTIRKITGMKYDMAPLPGGTEVV